MSIKIGVKIYPPDVMKLRFALQKVYSTAMIQATDLPYYNAVDYSQLVTANIMNQKYASSYAPLNRDYKKWKQQNSRSGKEFWALFNDLVNSITVVRWGKGWLGGVRPGAIDSGGKSWLNPAGKENTGAPTDITMYGQIMEYGRAKQPARPLFQPTLRDYINDPNGYRKRARFVMNKVKWSWS